MSHSLSAKDPLETVPLMFDFSALTAAVNSATVTVSVRYGVDASPNAIKSGSPVINGATVKQLITGGVSGATYNVRCLASTPDGDFLETGILRVENDI